MRRYFGQQRRSLCSTSLDLLNWPPPLTRSDIIPSDEKSLRASDYVQMLKECKCVEDLQRGKTIHGRLARKGFGYDPYVGNNLVSMYSRCGSLPEARRAFLMINNRDEVSWNVMIAAYALHGHYNHAFSVFYQMLDEGVLPNAITLVTVLNACTCSESLVAGKLVHLISCECGYVADVVLATSLVTMYGKCGPLEEAMRVFEGIVEKNVVSYNALVMAFTQRGQWRDAVRVFLKMLQEGIEPTHVSFVNVLNACYVPEAADCGKLVHACLRESEHISNAYIDSALISMYRKLGKPNEAREVIDKLVLENRVVCNAILAAADDDQAFITFKRMQVEGIHSDKITFLAMLSACGSLENGLVIHGFIKQTPFELDVLVGTALVTMYGKCLWPEEACRVFNRMRQRSLVSWTAVITACAENGLGDEALMYFNAMQQAGVPPNKITFISVLNGFASPVLLQATKKMHTLVVEQGLEMDISVSNALVTSYGKCGGVDDAKRVFETIRWPDTISWNAIVRIYVQAAENDAALCFFRRMLLEGVQPDRMNFGTILGACSSPEDRLLRDQMHSLLLESGSLNYANVQTALIHMYGKAGEIDHANSILQSMQVRDIVPWNSLISAYAIHGNNRQAFDMFYRIHQEGFVRPDRITFINMLNACTSVHSTNVAKVVQSNIRECGFEGEAGIVLALGNMYGNCNSLSKAREVFDNATDVCNLMSWNGMLSTYARHGLVEKVLKLARKMEQEGVKPDNISFMVVLTACSHAGYLAEAFQWFNSLKQDRDTKPSSEHYGCMIDLLARAGKLEEAASYACKMPSEAAWTSLLAASKLHRDVSRGKLAANKLLDLDPVNSSACVIMSSIMQSQEEAA